MAWDRDVNLSPDARSYVQSLRDSASRDAAREYAGMDDQAFRARIGPAVDEVDRKLDVLIAQGTVSSGMNKRTVAALSLIGGALFEGAVNAAQRFHLLH